MTAYGIGGFVPETQITLPYNWAPRPHQTRLWDYLAGGGTRAIEIAHRRWGKDDVSLHHTCCAAHERPASYVHMLPEYSQARKALWEMIDPHTGKRRIDTAFPMELRSGTNENEMMIDFKCGSTWQLAGSDNYNSLMGTSYAGMVFSEYALGNPSAWAYFSPILAENGGWATFITTPRGHNHAEKMLLAAQKNPNWFWEVSRADQTNVFTPEQLQEELEVLQSIHGEQFGRALWMQEYFVSFDAAIPGSIFGDTMDALQSQGRIGEVPLVPGPVHTGWDLGRTDDTVIWWFQVVGDGLGGSGSEVRIVDYHASNGKDVEFYANVLDRKRHERGFQYGINFLPHDARPRTLAAGGKSIWQQFQDWNDGHNRRLGAFTIAKRLDKQEQIQAARATLKVSRIDLETCRDGIEHLRQYHRTWDEELRTFSTVPVHDESSHAADAMMTVGVSWREAPKAKTVDGQGDLVVKVPTFGQLKRRHLQKARAARNPY